MRLLTLDMQGFLSFKEPTHIDLSEIGAAAIVGSNGAGKTSLVEAWGWSLFGKGRFRGPDDYVSVGTSHETQVAATFDLGGDTYRVVRQRKLGGKSELALMHLALAGGSLETWTPIGGANISETQEAINELLALDYDLWQATIYVAQGKADRFTSETPAKRKELMLELYGLREFERYVVLAKEHQRRNEADVAALDALAAELEKVITEHAGAPAQLLDLRERRERAASQIDVLEFDLEGNTRRLIEAQEAARDQADARRRLEETMRTGDTEMGRLNAELANDRNRLHVYELEITSVREQVAKLEAEVAVAAGMREQGEATAAALADLNAEREEMAKEISRLETDAARHVTEGKDRIGRREEAEERLSNLEGTDEAVCFTCGQDLSPSLRAERVNDLQAEIGTLAVAIAKSQGGYEEATTQAKTLGFVVAEAKGKAAGLQSTLTEIERALERGVVNRDLLSVERGSLPMKNSIRNELATKLEARQREVDEAHARISEEVHRLQAQVAAGAQGDVAVADAERALAESKASLLGARGSLEDLVERVGSMEQTAAAFESARTRSAEISKEREALVSRQRIHAYAIKMLGRDGLPTWMLENAVPAIEDAANEMLATFSDGRLSVHIEFGRVTKTAGLKETLDITVADEGSERPLEGFSGGEQQRVNMALRLALAEVLANRTGHRIETLIFDEAFTALDAEGRQVSLEVMASLGDRFPCTLFITHLPELAEAFPTRLEVTKDAGTSRVEVVAA